VTVAVSAALVGFGLGGLLLGLLVPVRRRRLDLSRLAAAGSATTSGIVTATIVALFERVGLRRRLRTALDRAGSRAEVDEVSTRLVLGSVVVGSIAGVTVGPVAALGAVAAVPIGVELVLARRAAARRDAFAEQLAGTLRTMVAGLRAGYSLPQAFEAVAQVGAEPTSSEFARLLAEVRVGRDLDEALRDLGQRVACSDFDWVAIALEVNAEAGGDLSEVLETVERTIRERSSLGRTIRSLSAEGRASAATIFALPFVTFGVIALGSPDYVGLFLTDPTGIAMAVAALVLLAVGGLWLRRIIRVEF
jgi:tight adherence protein B